MGNKINKFIWRGVSVPSQPNLEKLAKASLVEFFRFYPTEIVISLVCFKVNQGGNRDLLVKQIPLNPDFGRSQTGTSVNIYVDGARQGLLALLNIDGVSDHKVSKILGEGPYNRKQQKTSPMKTEPVLQPLLQVESAPAPVSQVQLPSAPPSSFYVPPQPESQHSPIDVLIKNGMTLEEVSRLKETLAHLLFENMAEDEWNGPFALVAIPVKVITDAVLAHMKLRVNSVTGTYQGIVGNFYTTRIGLFAYKDYEEIEGDPRMGTWLFNVPLIVDFVGGGDELARMARVRRIETETRRREEAEKPEPVLAVVVEKAVVASADDDEVVTLALSALAGKRQAEEDLRAAEEDARQCELVVQEFEFKLIAARANLARAREHTAVSKTRVSEFVISEEIKAQVSASLDRIRQKVTQMQKLAEDLGML